MYQAQKMILNKWTNSECYDTALVYWKIEWFNRLSRRYKRESLKYFMEVYKYIFSDIRVLKGIVKLIFYWGKS